MWRGREGGREGGRGMGGRRERDGREGWEGGREGGRGMGGRGMGGRRERDGEEGRELLTWLLIGVSCDSVELTGQCWVAH